MSSNTKAFEDKMKSAVEHLERELKTVRAGILQYALYFTAIVSAHITPSRPYTPISPEMPQSMLLHIAIAQHPRPICRQALF